MRLISSLGISGIQFNLYNLAFIQESLRLVIYLNLAQILKDSKYSLFELTSGDISEPESQYKGEKSKE
jgi:hypothetical protein